MFLKSTNGNEFSLDIVNYEFPDETDVFDGNWLLIKTSIKTKDNIWTVTDPSLETYDIEDIIEWFSILIKGDEPEDSLLVFTEPNITFRLNTVNKLTINFDLVLEQECVPSFSPYPDNYILNMEVSKNDASLWITDLIKQLRKFPVRNQ